MNKIKILYTIPNFNTAGSGRVVYDLVKHLDKSKFEVAIVCSNSKGDFFKEVELLGVPIHIIDFTKSYRPYFTLLSRIKPYQKFIQQNHFSIVHSWHWSSDWSEVISAKFAGAKFIYTKKAMSWGNIHWKIRSFLSDYIIATNIEMLRFFPFRKKLKIIPFGIDTDFFNSLSNEEKSIQNKFSIITVANLVPVKRIEVLIKAINYLSNSTIQLEIVGDNTNPYSLELRQLVVDLAMENQVRFLGKQTDIRSFTSKANLYVIPSKMEGMPVALLEAMSLGLPVLGSDIPGINYVLKDFSNLLFEEGNEIALATKIKEIYSMSEIERNLLGQKLRNYCVENFSMQKFIQQHEELYLKMANSN